MLFVTFFGALATVLWLYHLDTAQTTLGGPLSVLSGLISYVSATRMIQKWNSIRGWKLFGYFLLLIDSLWLVLLAIWLPV